MLIHLFQRPAQVIDVENYVSGGDVVCSVIHKLLDHVVGHSDLSRCTYKSSAQIMQGEVVVDLPSNFGDRVLHRGQTIDRAPWKYTLCFPAVHRSPAQQAKKKAAHRQLMLSAVLCVLGTDAQCALVEIDVSPFQSHALALPGSRQCQQHEIISGCCFCKRQQSLVPLTQFARWGRSYGSNGRCAVEDFDCSLPRAGNARWGVLGLLLN